ncbi:HPr family phosphocarrier protein [Raineyella sp.]|uniref:HPr family phosphocarrier protein n=1 Tax=Raineyella sp. TaxID=1911550 RepID=UPI002B214859|nr:HPr family phosphocarrier protein [Raineyella sp.]MEA5154294.1 HPr family phosphocarrier protein [Raineyella sp.]
MPSTKVIVGSAVGLHARPASIIAEAASAYDDEILISLADDPDEEPADASSSLLIMALGASKGREVIVESENEEAMNKIAGLVAQDLDV